MVYIQLRIVTMGVDFYNAAELVWFNSAGPLYVFSTHADLPAVRPTPCLVA